jgi:hypothetical protein
MCSYRVCENYRSFEAKDAKTLATEESECSKTCGESSHIVLELVYVYKRLKERTQTLAMDENSHLHIALRNPYLDRCVDDVNYIYWFRSTSDTSA